MVIYVLYSRSDSTKNVLKFNLQRTGKMAYSSALLYQKPWLDVSSQTTMLQILSYSFICNKRPVATGWLQAICYSSISH